MPKKDEITEKAKLLNPEALDKPGTVLEYSHTEKEIEKFEPVPLGREITPNILALAEKVAITAYRSGMTGLPKAEAAIFKILTGYELGLPMMASLKYIHAIKTNAGTTLALAPKGMLALIYNSGIIDIEITDLVDNNNNPVGCTVTGKRKDNWVGEPYEVTFTLDDARRANLIKPNGAWEMYPANMCRWRAVGFWGDVVCPDLLLGLLRTTDYTDQVDMDGIPLDSVSIDAEWKETQEVKKDMILLADLMKEYSPEQIIEANDNVMPKADEDLSGLKEKLEKGENSE